MNLRYLFKRTLPLALPALLSWGCTGDFERLNTNPYEVNPDDLPFEAQFLEPMSYSYPDQQNLFQYWTNLHIDLFGGYFGSPNGNFPSQRYNLDRGHCGGMHENFMLHIVNNTGRIIKQCDASGKADVAAMMRVVQTYNLLNYTDAYGPVPSRRSSLRRVTPSSPRRSPTTRSRRFTPGCSRTSTRPSRVSPPDRRTSRQRTTSGAGATRRSGPVWRTS